MRAQVKRLTTALGACTRDKARHEATLKRRAEEAEGAAAESSVALSRAHARAKEQQRRLADAQAALCAAGVSGAAVGSAAVRACQARPPLLWPGEANRVSRECKSKGR